MTALQAHIKYPTKMSLVGICLFLLLRATAMPKSTLTEVTPSLLLSFKNPRPSEVNARESKDIIKLIIFKIQNISGYHAMFKDMCNK